jgi:hypothetical protein
MSLLLWYSHWAWFIAFAYVVGVLFLGKALAFCGRPTPQPTSAVDRVIR